MTTVHIINYTTFGRQKDDKRPSNITAGQLPNSPSPIPVNDPTLPPAVTRTPSFGVGITFDPAMRKARKAYEADTRKSEKWLTNLAEENGGRIFLHKTTSEMIGVSDEVVREVGSDYMFIS